MTGERPRVGFIGLGDMGGPMAARIVDAGLVTTLWARRDASLKPYCNTAADVASSPRDLGKASDVVGICVFDGDGVRSVLLGDDGVLGGLAPGSVVLIHSTIAAEDCVDLAAAAAERGVALLDAPVTGGHAGAEAGTLTIMVGGDAAAYERALPVMQCCGRLVRRVGELGSGQVLKFLNNVLSFGNGRLASIAIETGVQLGLDVEVVIDVLRSGGAASASLNSIATRMMTDPEYVRHARTMVEKDTRLFQAACRRLGVGPTALDDLAEQRMQQIVPNLS